MSISFLHLPHIVVVAFLCVDHKMMKKEKLFVKVLAKCPLFNFAVECLECCRFQKCRHNDVIKMPCNVQTQYNLTWETKKRVKATKNHFLHT